MKCNVGKTYKIIRVFLGLVIILIGVYYKSWWGVIGLIPLITALAGWCPLYLLFRINTCLTKEKK